MTEKRLRDSKKFPEKTSMKCFKYKSHCLVSLQLLFTLDIFFGGNTSLKKNALTELYYNLSYETLSGGRDLKFNAISDLTADMSFQMKRSTFLNLKRKNEQDKKVTLTLKILMISFKSQGTMKNLKMN